MQRIMLKHYRHAGTLGLVFWALAGLVGCASLAAERKPTVQKPISIKIWNDPLNPVDDRLFGQFMERHPGEPGPESGLIPGTNQLQPTAMDLLKKMEIPIIRFPGGGALEGSEGNWPDFIDNAPGRETPREQGKLYGYHEFLETCEAIGATPLLVVNFRSAVWKSMPLEEAALRAAGLVAYANAPLGAQLPKGMPDWPAIRALNGHPEPFNVPIFQIGNEWSVFTNNIGRIAGISGIRNQVEWTKACIRAYAKTMRKVDPSIELIIDGQVWDDEDAIFVNLLLQDQTLKDIVQYVAVHFYRPWGVKNIFKNGEEVHWKELSDEEIWRACVGTPDMNAAGESILYERAWELAVKHEWPIVMTEWNWNGWGISSPIFNSPYTKGVGAAGFLNAMIREGDKVKIGCQSMLVGSVWAIMAIRVDPEAKHDAVMNPTGQVTAFYSQNHGPWRLRLETSNIPFFSQPLRMTNIRPAEKVALVDAVATASDDRVYVHLINRDFTDPQEASVELKGMKISGEAIQHCMEGKIEADLWEEKAWVTEKPIDISGRKLHAELPPRSVSIIEIPVTRK